MARMSKKALEGWAAFFALAWCAGLLWAFAAGWGAIAGDEDGWSRFFVAALVAAGLAVITHQIDKASKRAEPAAQHRTTTPTAATTNLTPRVSPIAPAHLGASDGILHGYHEAPVDWQARWREASRGGQGVTPFGAKPYWVADHRGQPAPLSNLAFWGASTRLYVAEHPETSPAVLGLIVDDPHPQVRDAARKRI